MIALLLLLFSLLPLLHQILSIRTLRIQFLQDLLDVRRRQGLVADPDKDVVVPEEIRDPLDLAAPDREEFANLVVLPFRTEGLWV